MMVMDNGMDFKKCHLMTADEVQPSKGPVSRGVFNSIDRRILGHWSRLGFLNQEMRQIELKEEFK